MPNIGIFSVLEISYSRFLKEEQKGFSYGLAYTYFIDFTVEDSEGQSLDKNPSKLPRRVARFVEKIHEFSLRIEKI